MLLKNNTAESKARWPSYSCEHPLIRLSTGTIKRLAPFEIANGVAFQPFCTPCEDPKNYYDRHPHDLLSQVCSFLQSYLGPFTETLERYNGPPGCTTYLRIFEDISQACRNRGISSEFRGEHEHIARSVKLRGRPIHRRLKNPRDLCVPIELSYDSVER